MYGACGSTSCHASGRAMPSLLLSDAGGDAWRAARDTTDSATEAGGRSPHPASARRAHWRNTRPPSSSDKAGWAPSAAGPETVQHPGPAAALTHVRTLRDRCNGAPGAPRKWAPEPHPLIHFGTTRKGPKEGPNMRIALVFYYLRRAVAIALGGTLTGVLRLGLMNTFSRCPGAPCSGVGGRAARLVRVRMARPPADPPRAAGHARDQPPRSSPARLSWSASPPRKRRVSRLPEPITCRGWRPKGPSLRRKSPLRRPRPRRGMNAAPGVSFDAKRRSHESRPLAAGLPRLVPSW